MPKPDFDAQEARLDALEADAKAAAKKPVYGTQVHVRKGEDPLSSRPFYVAKAAAALEAGDPDLAKQEFECSRLLRKALTGYDPNYKYQGGSIMLPLAWHLLPDEVRHAPEFAEYKKSMAAAIDNMDQGEVTRQIGEYRAKSFFQKAPQSYQDQTLGGPLVAPPEYGELIPLLRNNSVLMNIGCRQIALPPQGAIYYPRQTGAMTPDQLPENPVVGSVESNVTTDDLVLSAKQFIGTVRTSNQLLRFSQGAAEALIRDDMMAQIQLLYDKAGLEGTGGTSRVLGLVNTPGINKIVAKTPGGANVGDTWTPIDLVRMIAAAQNLNSDVKSWIMLPGQFLGITETRGTGGPVAGVQDGQYLFDIMRLVGTNVENKLRGRPVEVSNQVSRVRTKGTAQNLTYILGVDPQEIILGLHGAVELAVNTQADSVYAKNQSLLRVVMYGDVGVRRPAGITLLDNLLQISL